MTDLAIYEPAARSWVSLIEPAAELAKQIANTDFVPTEMRNKPAVVAACIMYGAEIGIGPMTSLSKVDIIKGRPAPKAELGRALMMAAGHVFWVTETTNTRVTVCGHRKGQADKVMTVTWTMDDVKKAGISNAAYQKYPRAMLLARASAELVRQVCPDVLGGITMFSEEAGDDIDGPVTDTGPAAQQAKATTRKRPTAPVAELPASPAPAPVPVADDLPLLPDEEPVVEEPTAAQIKKMMACFNEVGIKDRDDRLAFIEAAVRKVDSSKDLTVAEAGSVIDQLEQLRDNAMSLDTSTRPWTLTALEPELVS